MINNKLKFGTVPTSNIVCNVASIGYREKSRKIRFFKVRKKSDNFVSGQGIS